MNDFLIAVHDQLWVKILADYLLIPIILIGAFLILRTPKKDERFKIYQTVLLAGLTSYFVGKIVGSFFQPETLRPFEKLGLGASASFLPNAGFPSDHALFAMSISFGVLFGIKNVKWGTILVGLSILMLVGRVLALVHTPLDVIGGSLFALIGSLVYLTLYFDNKTLKNNKH